MNSTLSQMVAEDRDFYVECSLPPGVTVDQYRRSRPRRPVRRGRARLVRRLLGA